MLETFFPKRLVSERYNQASAYVYILFEFPSEPYSSEWVRRKCAKKKRNYYFLVPTRNNRLPNRWTVIPVRYEPKCFLKSRFSGTTFRGCVAAAAVNCFKRVRCDRTGNVRLKFVLNDWLKFVLKTKIELLYNPFRVIIYHTRARRLWVILTSYSGGFVSENVSRSLPHRVQENRFTRGVYY